MLLLSPRAASSRWRSLGRGLLPLGLSLGVSLLAHDAQAEPPATTTATAATAPRSDPRIDPLLLNLPPQRDKSTAAQPIYKTWWFWTGTGIAVSGVVLAMAIGLAPRTRPEVAWAP